MELNNEFRVGVTVPEAWNVLTDLERIAPMLPGAQLEEVEGDEYRGVVKVKVGPITAQYKGVATFLERDEKSGRVVVKASGRDTRGQGNANAVITATMVPDEGGTRVSVVTDLTVSGKVAQFGRGALADVSSKLIGQFVDTLEADLAAGGTGQAQKEPAPAAPAGEAPDPATAPDVEPAAARPSRSRRPASGPAASTVPRRSRSTCSPWPAGRPSSVSCPSPSWWRCSVWCSSAGAGAGRPLPARHGGTERLRGVTVHTVRSTELTDAIVFVAGDWRVTRGDYEDRVARAVTVLRQHGIGAGGCIGIALRNRPQFFELLTAATAVGAQAVPIAWRLKRDEVHYLAEDSGVELVVFDPEAAEATAGLPGLALDAYERLLAAAEPAADVDAAPTGFRLELYSSGTTGRPKAIERELTAEVQPDDKPPDTRKLGFLGMLGVADPDEVHLFCGPLYHSQPIGFATSALSAGHRVVMMEGSFDAQNCLRLIERERVTWMTCVPTHLVRILAVPDVERYDLSSIKAVFHSAAPCPRDVKARIMELFPPDTVWEVYGGTEGSLTMISPQEWLKKPGSVGRPFPPGTELHILDDDGNELPAGGLGLVYGRSPMMTRFRYRGAPELDAETWRGDLFTLGDVGFVDEDGYLFLADRKKDMIISGGANVYPAEVEAVLFNHPAVGDAAVIGVPDPEWGESVKAIVEPRAPVTAGEIIEHCRTNLAHYKCPTTVEFMTRLPRDPSGKVRKRELREPYWSGAGRAV